MNRRAFTLIELPVTRKCKSLGFTLIELLVVVSIIALLIAILMPTLRNARESARRVRCASNIRQCTIAWLNYAGDYNNTVYRQTTIGGSQGATRFKHSNYTGKIDWDIRPIIRPYLIELELWGCESVPAPPINAIDPDTGLDLNSRFNWNYCTLSYWPVDNPQANGEFLPSFGLADGYPNRISQAPASLPMIQDQLYGFGTYSTNHAIHGTFTQGLLDPKPSNHNPSSASFVVNSFEDVLGINVGMFDGSSQWVANSEIDYVGADGLYGAAPAYSVQPPGARKIVPPKN
jgi:prepilin-type N-terminal cleavage/methylation domain-containing protein